MWKQLIYLGIVAFCAAEVTEEEDVLVLNEENFDEEIAKHELLLVEFYAPWCGHCKSLAPEYAKAATSLKTNDPPIRLAKLDATEAKSIAERYEVQGFPSLKLFRGSVNAADVSDYDGGRTADSIEKWMLKKSGPSVSIITSQKELDDLKSTNEVVIMAYLDATDGAQKDILETVASADDNNLYIATSNAELIAAQGVSVPALVLFKSFDEGEVNFDGEFTKDEIAPFISVNDKPLIMTFSQEKASVIFGGDVDVHLLMFSDEEDEYHANLVAAARLAAETNKGKMMHIVIPKSEDRILDYFGFKEEDLPAIILVNMAEGMKKFMFAQKGDALVSTMTTTLKDDLAQFEADYFENKLIPTLKSAEPYDDSKEAVKVIVGKDFDERVAQSDKDVLLEFYAPWCGHCKNLTPKYEELAEKFAAVETVMIAKMDATENEIDHPGVNVEGFPTLIFFPAGDKQNPQVYEGDREVDGFTEFLKKNARSFELDGEKHGVSHDEL